MPASERVAAQLPYLRRFARAVTGSQKSGDAYVASTLEAVLHDPALVAENEDARIVLYSTLIRVLNSVRVNGTDDKLPLAQADFRLQTLAPKARQAFLLVSVEELSIVETAEVLGVTTEQVSELVDEAARDIANQIATDVLIIEDEPLIALDLRDIMTNLGHKVLHVARTRGQAIDAFKTMEPGLILADIQLADGSSGIDTVNEILTRRDLPVVFVTAYPERLLTGARPEPTFLITKPFQPDLVKAVVSQALFFDTRSRPPTS